MDQFTFDRPGRLRGTGDAVPGRVAAWLRRRWLLVALVAVLLAAWYMPTGWLVVAPGPPLPLAAQIELGGQPGAEPGGSGAGGAGPAGGRDGDVLLLVVNARRANPYRFLAWHLGLLPRTALLAESAMIPPGMTDAEYAAYGEEQMRESIGLAAVLALRAAGMAATATGNGARVVAVPPASMGDPAVPQPGDVVTAVADAPIGMVGDLAAALRGRRPGQVVQLTVLRASRYMRLTAVVQEAPPGADESALPALVVTDRPAFDLALPVAADTGEIGGPSAGLALALAIYHRLGGEDVLRGRTIAATGYVRLDGTVGPVGGVALKTMAAEAAGASVLFVAPGNIAEATAAAGEIAVVGVATFADALAYLRASGLTSAK